MGNPAPKPMDPNDLYRIPEFRHKAAPVQIPLPQVNYEHKESYGDSDDDAMIMAADLECIATEYLNQDPMP